MPRVQRQIIGIFGRINSGKSTLMNLLTQQDTSIVDAAPGTTADIKSAIMEIHGLGPVQLLDTAGLDEDSDLGAKKKKKTIAALEEVDLAILVIDPVQSFLSGGLYVEDRVSSLSRKLGKSLAVVFNIHSDYSGSLAGSRASLAESIEYCRAILPDRTGTPSLNIDLSDTSNANELAAFIESAMPDKTKKTELLPFVDRHGPVLLHIPLDEESPAGRLLRPQEMAMEYLLRLGIPIGLYRTDLKLARSRSDTISENEYGKFVRFLDSLSTDQRVQLVLTDSQAIDIMSSWVPDDIPLTTFSIMMINITSGGNLHFFAEGAEVLNSIKSGDRILIVEACNHDRISEDIGTVQIPQKLERVCPGIRIDHAFGREFPGPAELKKYRLAIHCGGCMISSQKLAARVLRLTEAGVPVANYGVVLSWLDGSDTLERVLRPWIEKGSEL